MSRRASSIILLALAAGCATPRKWTAPPKASLSFEGSEAVAREMAKKPSASPLPETGEHTTASEAAEVAAAAEAAPAPATPEAPPAAPEPPETAEASEGPGCPRERVYADEFKNLIQASGCGRLFYLQKVGGTPGQPVQWKRIGPEYQIAPQDDLHDAEVRLQGATLKTAVQVGGEQPLITMDQAKTLRSWIPKAVVTCLLGVDGSLHACFVQADEPLVEKAVAAVMPTYRYKPATADGVPIPATFQMTVTVPVPKPNCAGLSDPLRQSRCERDVRSPEGPAAVDPELWGLPLGQ